jgi:endonuclease YncB( thermonuclease family)
MIEVIVGAVVYTATFLGCYDGDTCTIKFDNAPEIIAEQRLRFSGFDTPEMRGECQEERMMATIAQQVTTSYMRQVGVVYATGERGKYGRLLVSAPELRDHFLEHGYARDYAGGERLSWCEQELETDNGN